MTLRQPGTILKILTKSRGGIVLLLLRLSLLFQSPQHSLHCQLTRPRRHSQSQLLQTSLRFIA